MRFGHGGVDPAAQGAHANPAFFPLALPSITGTGTIAMLIGISTEAIRGFLQTARQGDPAEAINRPHRSTGRYAGRPVYRALRSGRTGNSTNSPGRFAALALIASSTSSRCSMLAFQMPM